MKLSASDIQTFEKVLDFMVRESGLRFTQADAEWVKAHTSQRLRMQRRLPILPLISLIPDGKRKCKCGHVRHNAQTHRCNAKGCFCKFFIPEEIILISWDVIARRHLG